MHEWSKTGPKGTLQQYACSSFMLYQTRFFPPTPPIFSELLAHACTCHCLFPWQPCMPFAHTLEIALHAMQCPARKFEGVSRSCLSSAKNSLDIVTTWTTTNTSSARILYLLKPTGNLPTIPDSLVDSNSLSPPRWKELVQRGWKSLQRLRGDMVESSLPSLQTSRLPENTFLSGVYEMYRFWRGYLLWLAEYSKDIVSII